jgi:cobalt-zinc-cadmium efflux system outer membrane protein
LWPNPDLSLTREESLGSTERFATLSFPLVLSGRLGQERKAAESAVRAEEERVTLARSAEIRAGARNAFNDLLAAQERTAVLEEGAADLRQLAEALRQRERLGESSGFDRLRAERELADVESEARVSRGELLAARAGLASRLAIEGEELAAVGSLSGAARLPGHDEVRSIALRRGDVRALAAEAEAADLRASSSRRRGIPEPSLTLGAKSTTEGGESDTGPVVGLGFAIPIWDRGQGGFSIATAEAAALRAREAALARQAVAEAEAALAEAAARQEAATAYRSAGDPAELVRITRAAYDAGEMRILEVLDAYRAALGSRLRTIELEAAARRAEVSLERALGTEVGR